MDPTTEELFQEMIVALDGCTIALEADAKREKRKPATNGLRKITAQRRLAAVEKLIGRATAHLDAASE